MRKRSLHIAIDGRELLSRPTGVGRYLAALLETWALDPTHPHRYTVLLPAADEQPARLGAALARPGFLSISREGHGRGTWWEQTTLRRVVARLAPDVFFAPGYTAPLGLATPTVLVIHDVSFCAHPEWFARREGLRRRWVTRASARRARRILTVSEFSADEIVRYLRVPRDKIVVGKHGVVRPAAPSAEYAREPLVLFVGSLFNRRRVPELLAGFARARARSADARLVLVGDNRTEPPIDPLAIARALGVADAVEWQRYISDEALTALYDRAKVFLFLSDYEGFAMTPMEAMAHGVPPVLLDTPVAREIYGDAADLVSLDPDVIGDTVGRLLSSADAHAAAVARGQRHLSSFTWAAAAATAQRTLEDAATTQP